MACFLSGRLVSDTCTKVGTFWANIYSWEYGGEFKIGRIGDLCHMSKAAKGIPLLVIFGFLVICFSDY